MVSPAFDLLFLANLPWLLLLLPWSSGGGETVVDFWQIYYLTLPHRWLTFILVLADPDRRTDRGPFLILIATVALIVVAGVWVGTRAFTCLAMVDYVWNAWHFAAQHGGVLRIYTRFVGGGSAFLERHGIRFFVTYTILRTAAWASGWLEARPEGVQLLHALDVGVMVIPVMVLAAALRDINRSRMPKFIYLISISTLYGCLLLSISGNITRLVIPLTTASGLFHAVEYIAVVTHYAWRRCEFGGAGLFRAMAKRWLLFLGPYLAILGSVGVVAEQSGGGLAELWQGLNLWAALSHYAFDGTIWKLRRPATAIALGIQPAV